MKLLSIVTCYVLAAYLCIPSNAQGQAADSLTKTQIVHHLVFERTGFMTGAYSPSKRVELWLSNDKVCIRDRNLVNIYRMDLGKVWRFSVGGSAYKEYSLSDSIGMFPSISDTTEYQWACSSEQIDSVRSSLQVTRFKLSGESETSRMEARIWFASNLSSPAAVYYNMQFRPFWMSQRVWSSLRESVSFLRTKVIAEIEWSGVLGPGEMRDFSKLIRYEAVPPPERIFEVPKDGKLLSPDEEF